LIIIHLIKNNQDIRYYGGLSDIIPFVRIVFYTSYFIYNRMSILSGILFKRFNYGILIYL